MPDTPVSRQAISQRRRKETHRRIEAWLTLEDAAVFDCLRGDVSVSRFLKQMILEASARENRRGQRKPVDR